MENEIKKAWLEPLIEQITIEALNPFGLLNELDGNLSS